MEKLKYRKFSKKYFIQNLLFSFPLVLLFAVIWNRAEKLDIIFWISVILFISGIILGFVLDRMRLKNFHCPKCNKLILKPTIVNAEPNDPINYYCKNCDIEWETGLRVPDSPG